MATKKNVQNFFNECGINETLSQMVMSGAIPDSVKNSAAYSDKIMTQIHLINVSHALVAAVDLYSEMFTDEEIDELTAMYKRPVMKKVQESSALMVVAIIKYLAENEAVIDQEIDKILQGQEIIQ